MRIGRYVIRDAFASGGMATIHFGQRLDDDGTSTLVAIKRVEARMAQDSELVAALGREAKIAERVRHPNVLVANDLVAEGGEVILVMDYVHGASIAELTRACRERGAAPPIDVLARVFVDALRGLEAAHTAKDDAGAPLHIVHRDVSPQNIIVGVDGLARIADFGIATFKGRTQRTKTGQVKGTLTYLAPEQVHGGATAQSDVFAIGATAWEALVGRPVFSADTEAEVLARVLAGPIPRARSVRSDVPPEVDAAIARALERPVEKRFASAGEMADALAAATPLASREHVGEWVADMVAETLGERAAVIARLRDTPMVVEPVRAPRHRRALLGFGLAAVVLAAGTGVWLTARAREQASADTVAAAPDGSLFAAVPTREAPLPPGSMGATEPPIPTPDASSLDASSFDASAPKAARPRPTSNRKGKDDCNPPFVIDARRQKHFKPQCF